MESKVALNAKQPPGSIGRKLKFDNLSYLLEYFTIYGLGAYRLLCKVFQAAVQDRIEERDGRHLFEEAMRFRLGLEFTKINTVLAEKLFNASIVAECKTTVCYMKISRTRLSTEEERTVFEEVKTIAKETPYQWADFLIGDCYYYGYGGEENKKNAVEWYVKSIQQGSTSAMTALAQLYHTGQCGVVENKTRAGELLTAAAEKGDAVARFELGRYCRDGEGGLEINFSRCLELLTLSAEQGQDAAQFALGNLYYLGSKDGPPMTVPVNHQLAFPHMLASAKQKHEYGMFLIIDMYYRGDGVPEGQTDELLPQILAIVECVKQNAEKGDARGQYTLASCFEHEFGMPIDLVQALHWYQQSAAQGLQHAIQCVARLS